MADTTTTTNPSAALPNWSAIAEAGGIRNWVDAELTRRGLREDVDRLEDAAHGLWLTGSERAGDGKAQRTAARVESGGHVSLHVSR